MSTAATAVVERAALSVRRGQNNGELPVGIDPALARAAMFGSMQLVMVEALTRDPRPSAARDRCVVATSCGVGANRSVRRECLALLNRRTISATELQRVIGEPECKLESWVRSRRQQPVMNPHCVS